MKLKRCPFCNCHDLTLDVSLAGYGVRCFYCGAMGPTAHEKPNAAKFWNEGYKNDAALVVNRKSNHHELKDVEVE